jgi:MFS family permease
MAFMVEDFGYHGHELGYYVGGLASAFCAAQFCSSVFWGKISDTYGRKVAVISGTFGTAVGMLVFGTAKTYPQAICGRLLSGFLSGNLGVMKCFLAEITDDSNRGKGFSVLSSFWNVGCLVAPLFGGLLSNPCQKYPKYFSPDSLFHYYPYLLPCILCISMNMLGVVMCSLTMVETRDFSKNNNNNNNSNSSSGDEKGGLELTAVKNPLSRGATGGKQQQKYHQLSSEEDKEETQRTKVKKNPFVITEAGDEEEEEEVGEDITDDEASIDGVLRRERIKDSNKHKERERVQQLDQLEKGKRRSQSLTRTLSTSSGRTDHSSETGSSSSGKNSNKMSAEDSILIDDSDEVCCADLSCSGAGLGLFCCSRGSNVSAGDEKGGDYDKLATANPSEAVFPPPAAPPSVLRRKGVVLTTASYGLLAMGYILFDETIPLFLKLDQSEGGFSFDSGGIGLLVSISAFVMLIFTTCVLPTIASKSKQWLYEIGIIGAIPLTLGWPLLASLNYHVIRNFDDKWMSQLVLWALLLLLNIFKNMFACFSYTAVMIQINHSAENEYLGAVNGLGQSFAAAARAIGPAIGGILWSCSVKMHFMFLNFFSAIVIFFVCGYINRLLPPSIDYKKKKKSANPQEDEEDEESHIDGGLMH